MRLKKLPRSFYLQPTLKVARGLLGLYLVKKVGRHRLIGRIVEVEAYLGSKDPASHAFRGKTARNAVMFRQGGHLYVYFTYGMHYCSNVVTEKEGIAHAVLLRAVQPVEGIEIMKRNRGLRQVSHLTLICGGPARLCQAFGMGRKDNGTDLCGNSIWIARDPGSKERLQVAHSTRVGIKVGALHRWRFFLKGNSYVSPGRPAEG